MKIKHIKNLFPNIQVARFNMAVWQSNSTESLFFMGREVVSPGAVGEPDNGILKLFEVDPMGTIIQEKVIWKPIYNGLNLEDPRVLVLPSDNISIGLTAVLRDNTGRPVPFPALVKIDSVKSWQQDLPPFLIIETFGPGKNLTPVDKFSFLFRPESPEYNHKLIVFSLHAQVPEKLGDIDFPKNLPWASWRIGTTMPPIWLNSKEALFIIHGISKHQINGKDLYVYSIGRAKLTRIDDELKVSVAPDPILTPDTFRDEFGKPLVQELHPDIRQVVYSCGGVIKKNTQDTLSLYVNVGDRATFEVEFSLDELKEGLF